MIGQGFVLMIVGMLVVSAFLSLLVVAMMASAAFFKRFAHLFPEEVAVSSVPKKKTATDNQADIAVAIAAVKAFVNK